MTQTQLENLEYLHKLRQEQITVRDTAETVCPEWEAAMDNENKLRQMITDLKNYYALCEVLSNMTNHE